MGTEQGAQDTAAPDRHPATATPEADVKMVRRALAILVAPRSIVELRIPGVPGQGTVSGYFSDPLRLAESAVAASGRSEGVYVTLNPVKPELLARASNRLIPFAKHATSDRDVVRLERLLVDFDPKRPAGISSTDAQHEAALGRAKECREWLSAEGWPDPVPADSGNGGHLVYRVDLPNESASCELLRRCLEALAFRFNDAAVEVDTNTYNAARLVKVYGTLASKGDSLPDRPHRLARLLDVPVVCAAVPPELLAKLAGRVPKAHPSAQTAQHRSATGSFDLEHWIFDHHLDVDGPTNWKGGRRWIFKVCLWNPEHRRSAFILQFPNGAVAAGCLHKSCAGRDWHTLRDSIEPGWQQRQPESTHHDAMEAGPLPPEDRVAPFPVDALPASIARYVRAAAGSLGCPSDMVGVPALAALGAAIGTSRVLQVKLGWTERPVLFTAVVNDPGTLKSPALDKALKPIYQLQNQIGEQFKQAKAEYAKQRSEYRASHAASRPRVKATASAKPSARTADPTDAVESERPAPVSDGPPEELDEPLMAQVFTTDSTLEALGELLQQNPRGMLFIRDELTGWVRAMNQYRGGKGADRQNWLSFWNGAPAIVNRKGREPIWLNNPFVSVTGCLPPDVLGELTDERGREDGFVHRILFSFPDRADPVWTEATVATELVDSYVLVFERLRELASDEDGSGGIPGPKVLTFTEGGKAQYVAWVTEHYAEIADKSFPEQLRGLWAKLSGYCARLVLIVHECRFVSLEVETEKPDEESVRRAVVLIDYFKSHARRVYARLRSTPQDKRVSETVSWIRRHGGSTTLRDVVTYRVAGCATSQQGETLLKELGARGYGMITTQTPPSGGRQTMSFRLKTEPDRTI